MNNVNFHPTLDFMRTVLTVVITSTDNCNLSTPTRSLLGCLEAHLDLACELPLSNRLVKSHSSHLRPSDLKIPSD